MPKNKLISSLGLLQPLGKPFQKFIEENELFTRKSIQKNTPLLIHGKSAKELRLVIQGKFKLYQVDEDNKEQIVDFYIEGKFILVADRSLDAQGELPLYLVALENSELLSISLDAFEGLGPRFPESKTQLSGIRSRIAAGQLKHISILFRPPIERYALFVKDFSEICGRLSPKDICAFLAICPKTLQRSKILLRMKSRGRK